MRYLLLTRGNGRILADDFLALRMLIGRDMLDDAEMLTDTEFELGTRPAQLVDVTVMVQHSFVQDF